MMVSVVAPCESPDRGSERAGSGGTEPEVMAPVQEFEECYYGVGSCKMRKYEVGYTEVGSCMLRKTEVGDKGE
jgi:hypothetical protein